tara:strand:- start:114 stop:581 length:468 start_codon:yes stop_codon:yes gene_type:complete
MEEVLLGLHEVAVSLWGLVSGIFVGAYDLLSAVAAWAGSLLLVLHTDYPRLEGLLVGVLLAWLMLRRDRHPLLRVLSAPLKLVVDILDLAWDQVVEVISDTWNTAKGWVVGGWQWCLGKVKAVWSGGLGLLKGAYGWVMSKLKALKDALSKKKEG